MINTLKKISSVVILGGMISNCTAQEKGFTSEEIAMMRERVLKSELKDKATRTFRVSLSVPKVNDDELLVWGNAYLSASITLRKQYEDTQNEATFNVRVDRDINIDRTTMHITSGKLGMIKIDSLVARKSNLPKEDLFKVISFNIPFRVFNNLIEKNRGLEDIYIILGTGNRYKIETSDLENFRNEINKLIKDEDEDNTKLILPVEVIEEIEEEEVKNEL